MKKIFFLFVLLLSLVSYTSVWGAIIDPYIVYDINTTPGTSGFDINPANQPGGIVPTSPVIEYYRGTDLVPYPSHDGYGILDFGTTGFWQKAIELSEIDPLLEFQVTNQTPYTWSDYHFLFTDIPGIPPNQPINSAIDLWSDQFTQWAWDPAGQEVKFWAPNWVPPGGVVNFQFRLTGVQPGTFIGLEQIATTVPEPSTILLFGLGILGLTGMSRRKK